VLGFQVTAQWNSLDRPAELDSSNDMRGDERFVDDGDVITAAGISAGIAGESSALTEVRGLRLRSPNRSYIGRPSSIGNFPDSLFRLSSGWVAMGESFGVFDGCRGFGQLQAS
jgi:hypothetical protein